MMAYRTEKNKAVRETGPLQTKNVACDFSIIRDSDV